jgi:hypothetical protein
MRRLAAMVLLLGLVAAACGSDGATDAGPVPASPSTTVDPSTAAPTTTAPAGTTTDVAVWFVRGETLEATTRAVPKVARVGAEAVKALLAGPTAAEAKDGLSTAVPKGTRFNDLIIDANGIAKVDLSRDFESGGGSLGLTLRLAQVTCTVGQFPTVKGVRFALAGELVSVFSGNGIILDKPVTCDSYKQVMGQPAAFAGIWPFATRAQLDAYAAGTDKAYRDAVFTARDFAVKYIGMDNPVDFPSRTTGPGMVEVPIGPRYSEGHTTLANPQATFGVIVRQLGAQDASGPWTVVEAVAFDITVTTPKALDVIKSPAHLTGQARAFEGAVNVQIREDGMVAGQSLGKGVVTGGGDVKRAYTGDIAFRAPTKPGGAIVYTELSAADGIGIRQAAVVKIRF